MNPVRKYGIFLTTIKCEYKGKIYTYFILDIFSKRIGWSSKRIKRQENE